jgi:hypothetical protein
MKKKHFLIYVVVAIICISITACFPKSKLSIEEHALAAVDWEGESLVFEPVEGTREEILSKHEDERSQPVMSFTAPVLLGGDSLNVIEHYTDNLVSVDVSRNDLLVRSVEAGVISPISNFQGLWVVDEHWFLEVAHVDENPIDPNAGFIIWGEIFQDGESLNEKHGYDEAFNFQILDGQSFFFFSKDGEIGFSYNGNNTLMGYTEIPHYLCCSASAFNPLPSEKMVSFYATKEDTRYYVEVGAFK